MTIELSILLLTALPALFLRGTRSILFPSHRTPPSPPTPATSGRDLSIDAARAVAIMAVLVIHALYLPTLSPGLSLGEWVPAALINNVMRFAVPAFILVSGYCLAAPPPTLLGWFRFYWRKITRIFIPYVLVAAPLALYAADGILLSSGEAPGGGWNWLLIFSLDPQSLKAVLDALLYGTASPPFYFLIVLFQLYLLYPILRPLASRFPAVFSAACLIVSIASILPGFPLVQKEAGDFPFFFPYLYPFAVGMCLAATHQRLDSRPFSNLWVAPLIYLLLQALAATLLISGLAVSHAPGFYTYNFQFFYAVPLTLILCSVWKNLPRMARALSPAGRFSLWVFLLHFPAQQLVWHWIAPESKSTALALSLLLAIVSVLISWAICALAAWLRPLRSSPKSHP